MTRSFNNRVHCNKCGHWHTAETAFERWMRGNARLDSVSAGIVRFDCDVLLHQYKTYLDGKGIREVQNMMFVEVKTHGAILTDSQRDTLGVLNQLLRNRKKNIHASPRRQSDPPALTAVFSTKLNNRIKIALFGGHVLQFSNDDPANSQSIAWDGHLIDAERLEGLLRFEYDPDFPTRKIDKRRRYAAVAMFNECPLFDRHPT